MPNDCWIYEGPPDYVNVKLPPLHPSEGGGYILLFCLDNGTIRLFSSCNPGSCVSSWHYTARRFGLPGTTKVLVSKPFLRYTAVRRQLGESLKPYRDKQTDAYRIDMDTLALEAGKVFAAIEALAGENV